MKSHAGKTASRDCDGHLLVQRLHDSVKVTKLDLGTAASLLSRIDSLKCAYDEAVLSESQT